MNAAIDRVKRTPKQRVLKKYRTAICTQRIKGAWWRVWKDGDFKVILGVGNTPAEAWADADYFIKRYGGA
jgi:hypothetical protein